jgi:urease accessory protein
MKQHAQERLMHQTHGAESQVRDHLLATLDLGFARDQDTTRLIKREHYGPLRVQKALYPENPSICHAILIHPPGGVVGGDELRIQAQVAEDAHAFLTTPGAAKWYRSNGHVSQQVLKLKAEKNSVIEWMPQETILFNEADVKLHSDITLAEHANYIGCEILCFGRTASGEQFTNGRLRQRLSIVRDKKLIWHEQGCLIGGSKAMHSPLGLAGYSVCANLIAVGATTSAELINSVREAMHTCADDSGKWGVTQMKSVISARYLGNSSEVARAVMLAAWKIVRPAVCGHPASVLRIWNT